MIDNNVTKTKSITEFLEMGIENSYNLQNISLWVRKENIDIPYTNIFKDKYRQIIFQYCKRISLSNKALDFYKYNPKKVSYTLYGTTDLWHLILWINNMTSITQFNKNDFIIFDSDYLHILTDIIETENERLTISKNYPEEALSF